MVADLVNHVPRHAVGERAWLFDYQEGFETSGARFALFGLSRPGEHLDEVGGERKTRPTLGSREEPVIALADGPGLYGGQV